MSQVDEEVRRINMGKQAVQEASQHGTASVRNVLQVMQVECVVGVMLSLEQATAPCALCLLMRLPPSALSLPFTCTWLTRAGWVQDDLRLQENITLLEEQLERVVAPGMGVGGTDSAELKGRVATLQEKRGAVNQAQMMACHDTMMP